jgi:tetratricopeptide (TPR) repeat protein
MKRATSPYPSLAIQVGIAAILGVAVFLIYWRTFHFGFVMYDDRAYIVNNRMLNDGLGLESILWSFATFYYMNWHPMTWLSYLLDAELFGVEPRAFHRTNVLIHAMNAMLLFSWLRGATKHIWPSALVAILFAVHPLHVESVAWISERKDVLCTFFMLATLIAYSRYVRRPSSRVYVAIELLFMCALLSKPMVVTLPLILLVLDIWPYDRLSQAWPLKRLIAEKVPLFILAGASATMTLIAQSRGGAIVSLNDWPLIRRPLTAMASYWTYAIQTIFPFQLSVFYPRHWDVSFWLEALAGATLVVVTSYIAIRKFKRHPYFLTGWLWYLITLIPVIGIIQVGKTAHADRYTYIPQIGLLVMASWFLVHIASTRPRLKVPIISFVLVLSMIYSVAAYRQVRVWESSETLFQNAVVRSDKSEWAHWALGKALFLESDRHDEARVHLDRALQLRPGYPDALYTKARLLTQAGELEEAEEHVRQIAVTEQNRARINFLFGEIFLAAEKYQVAADRFQRVLDKNKFDSGARVNLGISLTKLNRPSDGITHFRQVLKRDTRNVSAHYNYALALALIGDFATATKAFEQTIALQPQHLDAYEQLIRIMEKTGRHDEAASYRETHNDLRGSMGEN